MNQDERSLYFATFTSSYERQGNEFLASRDAREAVTNMRQFFKPISLRERIARWLMR